MDIVDAFLAVANEDAKALRSVLEGGVGPDDARNSMGRSLLGQAACGGNADLADVLIERGADPNAPATRAELSGSGVLRTMPAILSILNQSGAHYLEPLYDEVLAEPLFKAIESGKPSSVQAALDVRCTLSQFRPNRSHRSNCETISSMTIRAIEHVQLAMPVGQEDAARDFYVDVLGLNEVPKPPALAKRGGAWFENAGVRVHLGVEEGFRPAKKAHPAFLVDDLDLLVARLNRAGIANEWDTKLPGFRRTYVSDPFGNRIELMQPI